MATNSTVPLPDPALVALAEVGELRAEVARLRGELVDLGETVRCLLPRPAAPAHRLPVLTGGESR